MASIFISYGRGSVDLVQALVKDLADGGYDEVWFDQHLSGGEAWWQRILDQIRASDIFLIAISPESLKSTPCRLEISYAESLDKPFLPVIVTDGVASEMLPPALSAIQFVDYRKRSSSGAMALIGALSRLSPRPLPEPLPEPPSAPISTWSRLLREVEADQSLNQDAQLLLAAKLRNEVREGDPGGHGRDLLLRLRAREDIYAPVAGEIDRTLSELDQWAQVNERDSENADDSSDEDWDNSSWWGLVPRFMGAAILGFPVGLLIAIVAQGESSLTSPTFWEQELWWYWIGGAVLALALFTMRSRRGAS